MSNAYLLSLNQLYFSVKISNTITISCSERMFVRLGHTGKDPNMDVLRIQVDNSNKSKISCQNSDIHPSPTRIVNENTYNSLIS